MPTKVHTNISRQSTRKCLTSTLSSAHNLKVQKSAGRRVSPSGPASPGSRRGDEFAGSLGSTPRKSSFQRLPACGRPGWRQRVQSRPGQPAAYLHAKGLDCLHRIRNGRLYTNAVCLRSEVAHHNFGGWEIYSAVSRAREAPIPKWRAIEAGPSPAGRGGEMTCLWRLLLIQCACSAAGRCQARGSIANLHRDFTNLWGKFNTFTFWGGSGYLEFGRKMASGPATAGMGIPTIQKKKRRNISKTWLCVSFSACITTAWNFLLSKPGVLCFRSPCLQHGHCFRVPANPDSFEFHRQMTQS